MKVAYVLIFKWSWKEEETIDFESKICVVIYI